MENSVYLGLSRQMVLRTNMDIIANNVANASTPGFRGQNLLFQEYVSNPRGTDDPLSFVYDEGQYQDTTAGPVRATGNPLDVAIDGPGFFGVVGPGGQTAYTRAGDFQIDPNGTLMSSAGFPIADAGGAQIVIPQGSTEIKIDERGFLSNQDGQLGQLMLVEFPNLQELEPIGDNMYTTNAATIPAEASRTKQGMLEGSNVKAVTEITRMIETLRSYQSLQQMLQGENERLRGAIRKLTGQSG